MNELCIASHIGCDHRDLNSITDKEKKEELQKFLKCLRNDYQYILKKINGNNYIFAWKNIGFLDYSEAMFTEKNTNLNEYTEISPEVVKNSFRNICIPSTTIYLDESLKRFTTVFPACGSNNSAVELSIDELKKYSGVFSWINVCKNWQA